MIPGTLGNITLPYDRKVCNILLDVIQLFLGHLIAQRVVYIPCLGTLDSQSEKWLLHVESEAPLFSFYPCF